MNRRHRRGPHNPDRQLPDIMSIPDVQEAFGIARGAFLHEVKKYAIPSSLLNGQPHFKKIDLQAWWFGKRFQEKAAIVADAEQRRLITVQEAAVMLNLPEQTIRLYGRSGGMLHYYLFGDQWLFLKSQIDEMLQQRRDAEAEAEVMRTEAHAASTMTGAQTEHPVRIEPLVLPFTGYVYILKYGLHYKIGKANVVKNRLRQLWTQMPEESELIHTMTAINPLVAENYLHSLFDEKRVNGEWFALTDIDLTWLKTLRVIDHEGTTL